MTEPIRLILGAAFLLSGLLVFLLSLIGVYKFDFVLNRMHCASLADTLGLFLILIGLGILAGRMNILPKLLLVLLFQWIGSPIAAHMVSRLETRTDPDLSEHLMTDEVAEAASDDSRTPQKGSDT